MAQRSSAVSRREPWPARIEGPSRSAVLREVGRAFRSGELAAVGPVTPVAPGRWGVDVLRLRERRITPAWRKPLLMAVGAVGVLGSSAALGWWLAGATAALASLPAALGGLVVALLLLAAARRSGGRGCTTTVTVTHRCGK